MSEQGGPPERALAWAARAVGPRASVEAVRRLPGGKSSSVHALTIGDQTLVIRQFVDREWLEREPDLASHEAAVLRLLERSSVPAPRLVAVDADGSESGHPSVLMSHLPGKVVLEPDDAGPRLETIASALLIVHEVGVASDELPQTYYRYINDAALTVPTWSREPDAWRVAFDTIRQPPPEYEERFIHRDFHPANILWQDERITGIVDWVNACRGPAGVDVGHCRRNLALLHGVASAEDFRAAYERLSGLVQDPYWDLMTAVEVLPEPQMFRGWTDLGVPTIDRETLRARIDAYVASIVERL
ncbi:MAG: aminoglycoside phosphotransferase family protein [Chloroflexi bacterium]|nr:aminoglycoside phosphotransferase family protein [Chloroflexota bacterium]